MLELVSLIVLGFIASIFGSIVGLGGGIIIVPSLILLGSRLTGAEIDHSTAVGTSLAVLIVTALASTLSYSKKKRVDFRSGWLLFITSGPAAMLGSALTGHLHNGQFQLIFGTFMLLMAGLLVARDYLKPIRGNGRLNGPTPTRKVRNMSTDMPSACFNIGFCVGLVSGLFGIGGGSLFVPVMVLLFRFPPHVATATSMFVIFLSSILGSGVHAALGEINLWIVLALIPGAWFGGKIGARIAGKMTGKGLLWLLRLTLVLLSAELIIEGLTQL